MSNSSLVNYTSISPKKWNGRNGYRIEKIFVHHMAGNLTVQTCGNVFKTRPASAHYGINGKNIGLYVDEKDTAWHCANATYNRKSIGIECANSTGASGGWKVSDETIKTLIKLLVDICKRNNIPKLTYTGDLKGNLCMHRWLASTACPGPYLGTKFTYIANEVNKELQKKEETTTANSNPSGITLPKRGYFTRGDEGSGVKKLQKWLKKYGFDPGEIDGDYGAKTAAAVKKFQKKYKLEVDGEFGKKSLAQANKISK